MSRSDKVTGSRRILVVDDEPDILNLMAVSLASAYEVTTASTPHQAIECCRRQRFHLAVVDVRLPGLSGMELVPWLFRDLASAYCSRVCQ